MSLRDDFPILNTRINGAPLVYLDNAATLQMPLPVLNAVETLYRTHNGNVHRSVHALGRATEDKMESAREAVRRFLGAAETEEIYFTAGTTDGVNALAALYADQLLRPGDEIVVTEMEHHSNFLPWVRACERTGAVLRVAPMTDAGELDMDAYRALLGDKTRLVAATWVSNALGTVNDAGAICRAAHDAGAAVLLDAAQAVLHVPVDVQRVGCDYLVFSGHKLGGLTGTGVLYARRTRIERFVPERRGGGAVTAVHGAAADFSPLPYRFEPGTPNYAGIIALGAAIGYIESQGREHLAALAAERLSEAETILTAAGVNILGAPARRAGAVSFTVGGVHPYDLAQLLDRQGVAVRSGHHCAQNTLSHFGVESAVRVSPAFYNTAEDSDRFAGALGRSLKLLRP